MEETGPDWYGVHDEASDAEDSVDGMLRELAAAPPVHPSSVPECGQLIGRSFRVQRLLGEGGMGVVYLAHDEELGRQVAVKVQQAGRSDRLVQRLGREARAMARVSHPNVVPVHEVGEHRGRLFIAMEYVAGGTARAWIDAVSRRWDEIVELYVAAGRGLAAAHAIGLVHRDFKPDNVLVGADGRPRVADFGLARSADGLEGSVEIEAIESTTSTGRSSGLSDALRDRITMTGAAVGTAQYMAPEQHGAGQVDARADQFSFCVSLYEALAGRRPFAGRTTAKLLHNIHLGNIREPKDDRRVPQHVLAALNRGLSPDPEDRYPDMHALLAKLTRKPVSRWRIVASVVALALVGVGAAVIAGEDPEPCDRGSRRLEELWSEDTRQELTAEFDSLDKAYARDALEHVSEPMGEYATRWGAAYRDACQATHVRHDQPVEMLHKRVACLDHGRRSFTRLVEAMRSVDDAVALGLIEAVHGLPRIEPCANLESLDEAADLPADPEGRRKLAELEDAFSSLRALDASAADREHATKVERLLERAEAIGYRPLIGRLRLRLAQTRYRFGISEDVGLPRSAFHDALAANDDRLALLAVAVIVRLHAGARSPEAHEWAETGRALLDNVDDPLVACPLLRAEAIAYSLEGDFDRAIGLFERVVELLLEHDPDDPNLARAYADIGKTYGIEGSVSDAEPYVRKALDTAVDRWGPHHPNVANYKADLARLRIMLTDHEAALELMQEAYDIRLAATDPDDPELAHMAYDLADLYGSMGDTRRALELVEPAVETLRGATGEDAHLRTEAEVMHASILTAERRFEEAREILERLLDEQAGDDHDPRQYAYTLTRLGKLEHLEGDDEAAIAVAQKAIEVIEASGSEIGLASALDCIGNSLLELDRPDEAIAHYERAIAVLQRTGRIPAGLARARIGLARALQATGREHARSQTLLRQAVDYLEPRKDVESVRLTELALALME